VPGAITCIDGFRARALRHRPSTGSRPANQGRSAAAFSRAASAAFFQRSASDGCPEQSRVAAASRPRTPAKGASVCGSVHGRGPPTRHRIPPRKPGPQRSSVFQSRKRSVFSAERVGWVPGAITCSGGFPARALRQKTPPFAAPLTAGDPRPGTGSRPANQGRSAAAFSRAASAALFQRSASDGCPEQSRVAAVFPPAHSGIKRLRLRLR
jgi:hypothetical protein